MRVSEITHSSYGTACARCKENGGDGGCAIPPGIRAILGQGKPVYLLLHAGGNGWTLDENKHIIENLNKWCPTEMKRDQVYLIYQDYSGHDEAWFGKEGVAAAIHQACSMPNYSGSRKAVITGLSGVVQASGLP